mmetsp:Transcript_68714/g.221995  ORF Transcript_68714/g.221995 Transcript_68714/m.221995 type:complete len:333 (-) Transcript_68714:214-1212(-)
MAPRSSRGLAAQRLGHANLLHVEILFELAGRNLLAACGGALARWSDGRTVRTAYLGATAAHTWGSWLQERSSPCANCCPGAPEPAGALLSPQFQEECRPGGCCSCSPFSLSHAAEAAGLPWSAGLVLYQHLLKLQGQSLTAVAPICLQHQQTAHVQAPELRLQNRRTLSCQEPCVLQLRDALKPLHPVPERNPGALRSTSNPGRCRRPEICGRVRSGLCQGFWRGQDGRGLLPVQQGPVLLEHALVHEVLDAHGRDGAHALPIGWRRPGALDEVRGSRRQPQGVRRNGACAEEEREELRFGGGRLGNALLAVAQPDGRPAAGGGPLLRLLGG